MNLSSANLIPIIAWCLSLVVTCSGDESGTFSDHGWMNSHQTNPLVQMSHILVSIPFGPSRSPRAVAGGYPAQARSHCRGTTHARVRIAWPGTRDTRAVQRLHWGKQIPERIRRWSYLFVPEARAAGVDPYLVAGVMRVESNGDPLIWNLDSDARGLMQVLHAPFEPALNVRAGVSMLSSLQHQFGNPDLVLAAYNAGPGSVQQYGGIPPFVETRDYVVLVGYYRDLFTGEQLSAARTKRFKLAWADLEAYHRRICGGI